MIHQAAYQPNAPCGLNDFKSDGHVKDRMKLKHQVVAVAHDMPTSRTWMGNALSGISHDIRGKGSATLTSAEYEKGTGPIPGE